MGFFDDLTKKASDTYKNTAEKTNKLAKEMKLKSLMNEDKNKIEKIYAEIGKKVYEKHIREENIDIKSELLEECTKIDAYAKEIEDMRMEMLTLKDLRLCKKCASEVSINAKFCPKCGAQQEDETSNISMDTTIDETETNSNNEKNEDVNTTTENVIEENNSNNVENSNVAEINNDNIAEIMVKENGVVEVNNKGFDSNITAKENTNVNYEFSNPKNNNQ